MNTSATADNYTDVSYIYVTRQSGKVHVILLDADDYAKFGNLTWSIRDGSNTFYAGRHTARPNRHGQLLHREIMGLARSDNRLVDHIDGNGLNNCKSNLRICTNPQNQRGQSAIRGLSKYKGVCWSTNKQSWQAQMTFEGKRLFIGRFASERAAAKAYDRAAMDVFGIYARTNGLAE